MTRLRPLLAVPASMLTALAALAAPGCGVHVQPLMPTPVVYTEAGCRPLDHIPEHERWIPRRIFYATTRERVSDRQRIAYGNAPSADVTVGMALVGFEGPDLTWSSLDRASRSAQRDGDVVLSIAGIMEKGRFDPRETSDASGAPERAGFMLESLRDVIDDARDRDVLVYVHGAKVNFYNACVFAAQLDHFMGRDLTSVAFAWPTHQNVLAYVGGEDVRRAYDAGEALAAFLELLADRTHAERIHVLSWSAGARVAMTGISRLHDRHPDLDAAALRARFRLGTAYFAAGDVPTHEFLGHVERIHDLVDQLVVTQTDDDTALDASREFIGGDRRIGQEGARLTPEEVDRIDHLERLEVIDVSLGAAARGFDIVGHRYWFDHPWASSDVLVSIRTRRAPAARGLEPGAAPILWSIPPDYPRRLRRLLADTEFGPSASPPE